MYVLLCCWSRGVFTELDTKAAQQDEDIEEG